MLLRRAASPVAASGAAKLFVAETAMRRFLDANTPLSGSAIPGNAIEKMATSGYTRRKRIRMMKKYPVSGEIGGAVRSRGHFDFRGLRGWRQMLSSLRIGLLP